MKAKIVGRGGLAPLLKLCDPAELQSDEIGDYSGNLLLALISF